MCPKEKKEKEKDPQTNAKYQEQQTHH